MKKKELILMIVRVDFHKLNKPQLHDIYNYIRQKIKNEKEINKTKCQK